MSKLRYKGKRLLAIIPLVIPALVFNAIGFIGYFIFVELLHGANAYTAYSNWANEDDDEDDV